MITKQGYAMCIRYTSYLEKKNEGRKSDREFYYDATEKPIALSLGQYGVYKEYNDNGQEVVLTYLDTDGNPLVTNKGYTTILRTYHVNNTVETERYYDLNGAPYSLLEGQYGIKTEEGQTIFLDKDGREIFNLKNELYNHSWLVILCTFIFVALISVLGKKWNIAILVIYIFLFGFNF